jgi:hypothetical protein
MSPTTSRLAALAAAATVALAAPAAATAAPAPAAHPRAPLTSRTLAKAHKLKIARAASVSDAWNGAGAMCVGTAMSISMGRNFGLPLGTHFAWRSRLRQYNPRTGVYSWTGYGPWEYDVMPNPSGYIQDSDGYWWFIMGPSGGILPTFSPTDAWTANGLWVTPYVQVSGYGEHPVNITDIAGTGRFSAPNWCYLG